MASLWFHQSEINEIVDLPMACPQKVKAKMLHPLVYVGITLADYAANFLRSWTGWRLYFKPSHHQRL